MGAAADTLARIQVGFAGLGVPWWGWTALLVMIFWGLLIPSFPETTDLTPEEQLAASKR